VRKLKAKLLVFGPYLDIDQFQSGCGQYGALRSSVKCITSKRGNLVSNVIQFLESIGANVNRGQVSTANYAAAVAALEGIGAGHRQALLDRDVSTLSELLDGRPKMFCMIIAPDSEEQQAEVPDESGGEPDGDKEPLEK
jgi:hypothetical protein